MTFYEIMLHTHSGVRWLALLLLLVTILKSLIGLFGDGNYSKLDNILAVSTVGTIHLQALLGLILYLFLSPIVKVAFNDFGAAMKSDELRFYAVEHITVMIFAVAAIQVGRSLAKKAEDPSVKFRFQAIFFAIGLGLILVGIPWDRVTG